MKYVPLFTSILFLVISQIQSIAQADFWQPTNNGLFGGIVSQISINSQDDIYIYAAQKLFRSTNNGLSYQEITSNIIPSFGTLTIDNADRLFTSTFYGIYRSLDHGATWDSIPLNIMAPTILSDSRDSLFAFNPNSSSPEYGILKSNDHGETWSHISSNFFNGQSLFPFSVSPLDSFYFIESDYTSGKAVLYKSSDYCMSWHAGLDSIPAIPTRLAFNSLGHIFATTYGQGIFRSTDQGNTWTQVNNGLSAFSFYSIHVDQNDDIIAGSWRGGVFISHNNGDSWNYSDVPNTAFWTGVSNSSNHIFLGSDGEGVFFSADGGVNWQVRNDNLTLTYVRSMAIDENDNLYAGTWNAGVFKSYDGGSNWTNTGLDKTLIFSLNADVKDSIYAADQNIYYSIDSARNWLIDTAQISDLVQKIIMTPSGIYYAATQQGVFVKNSGSGEWVSQSQDLPGSNIIDIIVDRENTLYCLVSNEGIFKKDIGSISWAPTNNDLPVGPAHIPNYVTSIGIDTSQNLFAFVSGLINNTSPDSTAGVFTSINKGTSWFSVNDSSWIGGINGAIHVTKNNLKLFSGSFNYGNPRILMLHAYDQSWIDVTSGASSISPGKMLSSSDGFIFCGGQGGVYKSTVSQSVGQNLVVINTNDSGSGSLRDALLTLNNLQNYHVQNTITFSIDSMIDPGCAGGNCTIVLDSQLPTIEKNVVINGETTIAIDGSSLGSSPVFDMGENSDGSVIQGLTFNQPVINSSDLTLENVILNGAFSHQNGILILINVTIDPTE